MATKPTMTDSEARFLLNHINMWGEQGLNAFVHKCGSRHWGIEMAGHGHPLVFPTKTEARRAAEAWIYAANGMSTEPYMYTGRSRRYDPIPNTD